MMLKKLIACGLLLAACSATHAAPDGVWHFQVLLDGKPIGEHTFTVTAASHHMEVHSVAAFDVKIMFINAYRYRHESTEEWNADGSCLTAIVAQTDDDGKLSTVEGKLDGNTFDVAASQARPAQVLPACVMGFAYWNPAMLKQTRLLNVQTGKYELVRIAELEPETIDSGGRQIPALHYRLTGTRFPIDLWYAAADQRWLALQSTVKGGHLLRYQLSVMPPK